MKNYLVLIILTDDRHGECISAVDTKYLTRIIGFGFGDVPTFKRIAGIFFYVFSHIISLNWTISAFTSSSLFIRAGSTFVR